MLKRSAKKKRTKKKAAQQYVQFKTQLLTSKCYFQDASTHSDTAAGGGKHLYGANKQRRRSVTPQVKALTSSTGTTCTALQAAVTTIIK